jgi:hypothetical protein
VSSAASPAARSDGGDDRSSVGGAESIRSRVRFFAKQIGTVGCREFIEGWGVLKAMKSEQTRVEIGIFFPVWIEFYPNSNRVRSCFFFPGAATVGWPWAAVVRGRREGRSWAGLRFFFFDFFCTLFKTAPKAMKIICKNL